MQNQKLENQLNLALDTSPTERSKTLDLNVGYDTSTDNWELIVKYNGDISKIEKELNAQVVELISNYAIVTVRQKDIDKLANYTEVEFVEKPKQLFFSVNNGKKAACITNLQINPPRLFGAGIIIAVIDSGIDYAHPDFRNADGTTRIISIWDQTIPGNPPTKYKLGSEYPREKINEALSKTERAEQLTIVPSVDISGHGTHVAGIAGGNGRASEGRYIGVAPQCEFIIVKLGVQVEKSFPKTTQLMQALSYVLEKAVELKKPIAINLSYGNNYGSHDGRSLVETYIDSISDYWKSSISVGTGNEGSASRHARGVLRENIPQTVEIAVESNEPTLNLQIWKSYSDEVDISIVSPSGITVGPLSRRLGTQKFTVGRTKIYLYYGEPSPYNKSQEIYIELIPVNDNIDDGIWKIILTPKVIVTGNYDMWLPVSETIMAGTKFRNPSEIITLTIPSTSFKVISVGAYNSLTNSIADFSGRGFTRNEEFAKPDIVAPGVDITSASPGGGYTSRSGTSMATPFVTGAAGLLMEWGIVRGNDPFLYGEKVKAYLINGAKKIDPRASYPNRSWGYGALCLENSFNKATFVQALEFINSLADNNISNNVINNNKLIDKTLSLLKRDR